MEISQLSAAWIKAEDADDSSSDGYHWSIDYVIDLALDEKYEELWEFVKHTNKQEISNLVVEVLATGPLEDLLAGAGERYIAEIEELAKSDAKFS